MTDEKKKFDFEQALKELEPIRDKYPELMFLILRKDMPTEQFLSQLHLRFK